MEFISGNEYHRLIVAELLRLPRHTEFSRPDCVEFGSNFTDLGNAAFFMSHAIWFPRDFIEHGVAGNRLVEPCEIRTVWTEIVDKRQEIAAAKLLIAKHGASEHLTAELAELEWLDGRPFVKFELVAPGRTGDDFRQMFYWKHQRRMALDRQYEDDFVAARAKLIAYYLDARDAHGAKDATHLNANGQENINVTG